MSRARLANKLRAAQSVLVGAHVGLGDLALALEANQPKRIAAEADKVATSLALADVAIRDTLPEVQKLAK